MDWQLALFPIVTALTAVLFRLPFLNFPLDDDFAIYTYRARFASRGLQWKKDLQVIGTPIWRMHLMDKLYGTPGGGVRRIRLLQTGFHAAASVIIFFTVCVLTQNPWAGLAGGLLVAFYGTSPDLTAGSFNHEQFYIPFTLLGLMLLCAGPEWIWVSGLCFGLATVLKYNSGLYIGVLMWVPGWEHGFREGAVFAAAAALPFLASNLMEWSLGYWDAESRKQMMTRLATTLRLSRTKRMYFSIAKDIRILLRQTFPVWLAGVPGLGVSFFGEGGIQLAGFTLVTLAMIFFQRAFSRYHYLPWIALLSLGSGLGLDVLSRQGSLPAIVAGIFLAAAVAWNVRALLPFYLRPTDRATLARCEKFDQYIYLPYLGRLLKRLVRMRGETGARLFVWGTFSQLYHETELPAADNFLHYSIGPWDTPDLEGFFDGVIGGLIRHCPLYLVKAFPDLDMDRLEQVTGLRYRLMKTVLARFPVYRLEALTTVARDPLTLPWKEKMLIMEALTEKGRHVPGIDRTDLEHDRLDTIFRECRKLVRLNPEDTEGWFLLGELSARVGNAECAVTAFENVLQKEPARPHSRLLLSEQKARQGKLEEAAGLVEDEIRRFGESAEAAYYQGLLYQHLEQHRPAVRDFERYRTEFPDRLQGWVCMIESLVALRDREHLKRMYGEAWNLSDRADREWIQTKGVLALAEIDTPRPASETLSHFLERDPDNQVMHYARASALEREGEIAGAGTLFERIAAAATLPNIRAGAWFRAARLAPRHQREELLQRCLTLDPHHEGAEKLYRDLEKAPESRKNPV